jgi:hypothetical protein
VRDFLAARTKTESGARIQARPLYDAYVSWCRAYNTSFGPAISEAGVGRRLEEGADLRWACRR